MRSILRRLSVAALLLGLGAGHALADGAGLATTLYDERGKALGTAVNPLNVTGGSGGGGSGGTVAQGAAGSSPWPAVVAQYNATLPTLTSGATAYLAVDSSGRLIQSPGASVAVSNFPASQPVSNAGTFAVQNTAAVVGGNSTAVKTDGSGTMQPVSAAALPLPAGAATAANQGAVATSGGVSSSSRIAAATASTNATVAKASPGRVYKIYVCNYSTSIRFIKFYNVATTPTPGTTPVFFSRAIPASATAGVFACVSFDQSDLGWYFSTGIAYALTALNADSDATAIGASDIAQLSVEYQ